MTQDRVERVYEQLTSAEPASSIEVGSGIESAVFGDVLVAGSPAQIVEQALETLPGPDTSKEDGIRLGHCSAESVAPGFHFEMVFLPAGVSRSDCEIRAVRPGDVWVATGKPVRDDLRAAGIHPLARPRVSCVATRDGVLFVPGLQSKTPSEGAAWDAVEVSWWVRDAT